MQMRINYLAKNIILGFIGLIMITILIAGFSLLNLSIWCILLLAIFMAVIFRLLMHWTKNFVSGLIGEKDIDNELFKLGGDYFKISDFNTGRGNIDKIVAGPSGIWTLEVKNHAGSISFNGKDLLNHGKLFDKDFLKQAYAEAKTLQDIIKSRLDLDINVQPVLVFSNKYAKVKLGLNKKRGVYVIQKRWLKKLITETYVQNLDASTLHKIEEIVKQ